jgi:alkylation response protein AidB-like acyl-CoA dehydrogenase
MPLMDFSLSEPERELVALCRDFAQNEIAPRAPAAWEEARCPTDLLRERSDWLISRWRPPYRPT